MPCVWLSITSIFYWDVVATALDLRERELHFKALLVQVDFYWSCFATTAVIDYE